MASDCCTRYCCSVKKEICWRKVVEPAVGLGLIFHFVSLVESTILIGHLSLASIHYSESMLAFLAMVVFFVFFVGYRTTSLGIVIFPIVFVLTFVSAIGQNPVTLTSPLLRSGWIFVHIVLIFTGYAGLFLSFGASLLYLVQERALKSKRPTPLLTWLPPLQTIDDICYHALLFGFPFMTFGIVTGSVLLIEKYGPMFFVGSEDCAVVYHVGGVHAAAVHALEFGMARPPGGVPGDLRLRHRDLRLGGEQFQPRSQVYCRHELRPHRREPSDRTGRGARAVRHSRGAAAGGGEGADLHAPESKRA